MANNTQGGWVTAEYAMLPRSTHTRSARETIPQARTQEIRRIVAEYQEEARKALDMTSDPAERIRSAVRAVSEVMYRHQEEILLIYQDSHLLEPRSLRVILARVEEFIGMFESILVDAGRQLGVPVPQPHLAANIVTFLPVMIALRRWSLQRALSHEQIVDGITEFAVRGLGIERSAPGRKGA